MMTLVILSKLFCIFILVHIFFLGFSRAVYEKKTYILKKEKKNIHMLTYNISYTNSTLIQFYQINVFFPLRKEYYIHKM